MGKKKEKRTRKRRAIRRSKLLTLRGKGTQVKRNKHIVQKKNVRRGARPQRRRARAKLMAPRQVAVRAQESAFQLLIAVDRGGLVPRFLRWYASERKRPGRIANPWRYRDLVETIRRESFLVVALQVEAEAQQRLGVRAPGKMSPAQSELVDLFHEEFFVALGRALDFSDEEFNEFCRDLEIYRSLRGHGRNSQPRTRGVSAPAGPFVDRCGFLLDSPMLDEGRRAAAKFEAELIVTASSVLRRVFSRRYF